MAARAHQHLHTGEIRQQDSPDGADSSRRSASGHITIVQEERFMLVTDRGQGLLLDLATGADVSPDALRRYAADRSRVRVSYSGRPSMVSGVAHAVQLTEEQAR